ncbi:DELLA protein GAI1 [Dendrobium catenatum]|uniref:DELLA protein GAI1 n=1 Tax=Dendrobium catenatum TaxID=906689 RepID=A0A2I0WP18_9ASPA|nr:DELLA protein GAI1 [Dendrobium catenatum]
MSCVGVYSDFVSDPVRHFEHVQQLVGTRQASPVQPLIRDLSPNLVAKHSRTNTELLSPAPATKHRTQPSSPVSEYSNTVRLKLPSSIDIPASGTPAGELPNSVDILQSEPQPANLQRDSEDVIRLVHALMACAEAVNQENFKVSDVLVRQITVPASSQIGAIRKVVGYLAEALARKIYRFHPQQDYSLNSAFSDIIQMHFYESYPYLKFAHFTADLLQFPDSDTFVLSLHHLESPLIDPQLSPDETLVAYVKDDMFFPVAGTSSNVH